MRSLEAFGNVLSPKNGQRKTLYLYLQFGQNKTGISLSRLCDNLCQKDRFVEHVPERQ